MIPVRGDREKRPYVKTVQQEPGTGCRQAVPGFMPLFYKDPVRERERG